MIMSTSRLRPLGRDSELVRYMAAIRAHSRAARPSAPSWLRENASWRTCPCPEACTRAGMCMLVTARANVIAWAREEVKAMRAGVRIVRP